jgi:hypothetical protein
MKTIKTAAEVFAVLGSTEAVMEITGAKRSTVGNWRSYSKDFPSNTYLAISAELYRRGYRVDPELFSMKPDKARRKAA